MFPYKFAYNLGFPGADAVRASNTRSIVANDGLSAVLHRLGPLAVSVTSRAEAVQAAMDIGRLLGFAVSRTGETLEWSVEGMDHDQLSLEILPHNPATASELARIVDHLTAVLSKLAWRTATWLPTSLVRTCDRTRFRAPRTLDCRSATPALHGKFLSRAGGRSSNQLRNLGWDYVRFGLRDVYRNEKSRIPRAWDPSPAGVGYPRSALD